MLEHSVNELQNNILNSLNEILLLVYGTDAYHEILSAIKKAVHDTEQRHKTTRFWQ